MGEMDQGDDVSASDDDDFMTAPGDLNASDAAHRSPPEQPTADRRASSSPSGNAVRNPLYHSAMVSSVRSFRQWSPAIYPFLHREHPQLSGRQNTSAVVPRGLDTNRYVV